MAIIPTIRCRNMRASLAFYTTVLDFEHVDGDDDLADPSFSVVARDGGHVFLSSHRGDGVTGQAVAITTDDVDALVKKFRERGLQTPGNPESPEHVHEGPIDQSWGTREFYVDDPDGNTLRFTQPAADPGAAERHRHFLTQSITLASQARRAGNHPFGALLVVDGEVVLTAENSVHTDSDPTAHAETNLVALAVRSIQPEALRHAVLYTSCEPCAMCSGKIYWAGIRAVVYALSSHELAALAGRNFLVPCRDLFAQSAERVDVVGPLLIEEARAVHVGYWTPVA